MAMSKECVIGVDVGGTTVEAAVVSRDGAVIGRPIEWDSPSNGTADEIVNNLATQINEARNTATNCSVTACGIGMPGPFDYEAGISHMEHKFADIKELELGKLLEQRTGLPTRFVNDAAAFGLGVSWKQLPNASRLIGLTIGTGLGSSFIEEGVSIENDDRVPPGGEMWNYPYGDGILEDIVSGRGIASLYEKATNKALTAKEVAELAKQGSPMAKAVYREVGRVLGRALVPVCVSFLPEVVVVGGKIGRDLELFGPKVEQVIAQRTPEVQVIKAQEGNLAILGAAKRAFS